MIRKTTGRRAADLATEQEIEASDFGMRQIIRRASDHIAHQQDQIVAKAIAKVLGEETPLESLRGRLEMVMIQGSENRTLYLDGKPLIEFYPLRSETEHRNGSHFLNLSQPYRLFEWELPA